MGTLQDEEHQEGVIIGQSDGKWILSVLKEAMRTLYRLTEDEELKSAIRTGKMFATDEKEKDQIYMLSALYREEMSGNLKPPPFPSLKKLYREIADGYE